MIFTYNKRKSIEILPIMLMLQNHRVKNSSFFWQSYWNEWINIILRCCCSMTYIWSSELRKYLTMMSLTIKSIHMYRKYLLYRFSSNFFYSIQMQKKKTRKYQVKSALIVDVWWTSISINRIDTKHDAITIDKRHNNIG